MISSNFPAMDLRAKINYARASPQLVMKRFIPLKSRRFQSFSIRLFSLQISKKTYISIGNRSMIQNNSARIVVGVVVWIIYFKYRGIHIISVYDFGRSR